MKPYQEALVAAMNHDVDSVWTEVWDEQNSKWDKFKHSDWLAEKYNLEKAICSKKNGEN